MTDSENKQRKKILFLTSRFPWPLEKGDKLRAFHLIKELSASADVFLFAINDTEITQQQLAALQPYCKAIRCEKVNRIQSLKSMFSAISSKLPFQAAYFYAKSANSKLKEFAALHQPQFLFCHLLRMAPYATSLTIEPSMLDYMDAFAKGMNRYADNASFLMKSAAKIEADRVEKYEAALFDKFNHHSIISAQDRTCIQHPERDRITVLPNGVDMDYYKPMQASALRELIFLGNMAYPPNIASASFAVKRILPELDKIHPGCRLMIAGATPAKEVLELASSRVEVSGWVDDTRIPVASSRIMIAPMLISIGLQNKILQAMAMKVPCVVSSLANNAIGAVHDESILVADTPQEYAMQINRLLNEPVLRERITENALNLVRSKFSWQHAGELLKQTLGIAD